MNASTDDRHVALAMPHGVAITVAAFIRTNLSAIEEMLSSGATLPEVTEAISRKLRRHVPFYTVRSALKRERCAARKTGSVNTVISSTQPATRFVATQSGKDPSVLQPRVLGRDASQTRVNMVYLDADKRAPLLGRFFDRPNPLLSTAWPPSEKDDRE